MTAVIVMYDDHMDMNEATAKAIAAERSIAGLTVRELAQRSGIPERSLMRVLQAEREIKVNQIAQLAAAMELYPHEIVETAESILDRSARQSPRFEIVADDLTLAANQQPEDPDDELEGQIGI